MQPIDKKSANVICDLHGQTSSPLIVGAHFDFADEGQGIVDDWSGVSTSDIVSLTSNARRYLVGGTAELHLPLRFSVELDAICPGLLTRPPI